MRYRHCWLLALVALALVTRTAHAQEAAGPGAAAEVNGKAIYLADVDAKIAPNLGRLYDQIYRMRQVQLDSMIDEVVLADEAARRGVPIATLVQTEVIAKVPAATPEEVARFYEDNKSQLSGEPAAFQDRLKNRLNGQRRQDRMAEYLTTLRASATIAKHILAPQIVRSDVRTTSAPVRGNPDAPITIVEFSDFHCPFCRAVQPVLEAVRAKYGDKVKIVYRDFPVDNLHPQASAVAAAARCAQEQDKFWDFHDKVFRGEVDGSAATLDRFATEVGMDVGAFAACRTSVKYNGALTSSMQEAVRLGITGTPTFFINGRTIVGAQPLDTFSRVIDEELAAVELKRAQSGR